MKQLICSMVFGNQCDRLFDRTLSSTENYESFRQPIRLTIQSAMALGKCRCAVDTLSSTCGILNYLLDLDICPKISNDKYIRAYDSCVDFSSLR